MPQSLYELIFVLGAGLGWAVILLLSIGFIVDWRSNRQPKEYRRVSAIFSDAHSKMDRVFREQAH